MNARRDALSALSLQTLGNELGNAALILEKYLESHSEQGGTKNTLITNAKQAAKADAKSNWYKAAYQQWQDACKTCFNQQIYETTTLCSADRIAIGLGNSNPLELGLTLHRTYGLPYLPGSALKGLASAYAAQVWAQQNCAWACNEKKQGAFHALIFGDNQAENAGVIAFCDAWLVPPTDKGVDKEILIEDVMTPHYNRYYRSEESHPVDWDSPVPIPFITTNKGLHFHIILGCPVQVQQESEQQNNMKTLLDTVGILMESALKDWGIGGKTNAGYGRFEIILNKV